MSNIFENLLKDPEYKKLLDSLPEDEKGIVVKALKEITERFERNLLDPLRKINKK